MNCKISLIACIFTLILFSCGRNKDAETTDTNLMEVAAATQNAPPQTDNNQEPIPAGNATALDSSEQKTPVKTVQSSSAPHIDWDKKIIKNANLKLEVKDFHAYAGSVYQTVKQYGGYIAQENQNLTDEKLETTISIKVPVDQFENMMNQLPGKDIKVIERKISTDDVTGEIVDVQSRLEAKKQMRQKYLDFFKQAKNMEEVLKIQTELNGLQETMESAAGRISYLNHQSAMSTILLTFYQPLEGFRPSDDPSFLTRITDAFKAGGKWLGDMLIGIVALWPLILLFLVVFIGYRKFFAVKIKKANS